jgi:hypothetical protein
MNKTYTLIALIAAAALLPSCKTVPHYLYAPTAVYTPMFNKKGDVNATGMYTTGSVGDGKGYNNGYDVQAGYAFSSHFALTLAISGRHEKNRYDSTGLETEWAYNNSPQLFYQRHTTELGIGYFTPLNSRGNTYFDFYAGYGFGRYNMTENDLGSIPYSRFHNTSVGNLFFQPGLHFNFIGGQFGFNSPFTITTFYNISTNYTAGEQAMYYMDAISSNAYVFWEPSLTLKLWVPNVSWVRLDMEAGFSGLLSKQWIDSRGSYASIGLSFNLPKLKDGGRMHYHTVNY